jgi:hypothetical protein
LTNPQAPLATQDIPTTVAIIAHTASGITGVESGTGSNIPQVNGGMGPPIDNGNIMNSAALDKLPEFPACKQNFILT